MPNEPVTDVDRLWLRLQDLYEDFRESEAKLELRAALGVAWELGKRDEAQQVQEAEIRAFAEAEDLAPPAWNPELGRNPFKENP